MSEGLEDWQVDYVIDEPIDSKTRESVMKAQEVLARARAQESPYPIELAYLLEAAREPSTDATEVWGLAQRMEAYPYVKPEAIVRSVEGFVAALPLSLVIKKFDHELVILRAVASAQGVDLGKISQTIGTKISDITQRLSVIDFGKPQGQVQEQINQLQAKAWEKTPVLTPQQLDAAKDFWTTIVPNTIVGGSLRQIAETRNPQLRSRPTTLPPH